MLFCIDALPLPKSHHQDDSSESHVEVQNKSFPEVSGPSLVLRAKLDLAKQDNKIKISINIRH